MNINRIKDQLAQNAEILFVVDGLGAALSAVMLGVVIPQMETFFGLPSQMLCILAIVPIVFLLYDFFCYLYLRRKVGMGLRIIASLNLVYCLLSLYLATCQHASITIFGWGYLFLEIIIIVALASLEFIVSKKAKIN